MDTSPITDRDQDTIHWDRPVAAVPEDLQGVPAGESASDPDGPFHGGVAALEGRSAASRRAALHGRGRGPAIPTDQWIVMVIVRLPVRWTV